MALSTSASSSSDADAIAFNLLATEGDETGRLQLLKKHDTLKSKMEELKMERAEQNKKKKQLTAALKLAQRKKNALSGKPAPCLRRTLFKSSASRTNRKAKKKQSWRLRVETQKSEG